MEYGGSWVQFLSQSLRSQGIDSDTSRCSSFHTWVSLSQSLRSQGIDSDGEGLLVGGVEPPGSRNPFVVRASIRTGYISYPHKNGTKSQSLRSQGIDSDRTFQSFPEMRDECRNPFVVRASIRTDNCRWWGFHYPNKSQSLRSQGIDSDSWGFLSPTRVSF